MKRSRGEAMSDFRELAVAGESARVREMSRRSRKRGGVGERRWLGKAGGWLLVLGVLGFGAGYGLLRRYLHSDAFRIFLSAEASEAAGVKGEFAPFSWHGLAVDTESFEARGAGPVTGLRADGLHTEIGLGGVRRGVWEILDSNVRRLEVSLDTRKPLDAAPPQIERGSARKAKPAGWFPKEAELQGLDVRELVVKAILNEGLATASGMNVHAESAGAKDSYRAEIEGGTIRLFNNTAGSVVNGKVTKIANENYARELLELFCFGVDSGYDQQDIVQLSRVWTGWSVELTAPGQETNPLATKSTVYIDPSLTGTALGSYTNLQGQWAFKFKSANPSISSF